MRAKWVAIGMDIKLDCGDCVDGKPPNYRPYTPPEAVDYTDSSSEITDDASSSEDGAAQAASSGECSALTQNNVFFDYTGPEGGDHYQAASDWSECCTMCQNDGACRAWCAGEKGPY